MSHNAACRDHIIIIFVLDEIQRGGLVYCMKEILNVYSGKEADCIKVFLQAVNI